MFYSIYASLIFLFFLLYKVMEKRNKKAEENFLPNDFIITQPKFCYWLGICIAVVFFAFTILAIIFPETAEWYIYLFFIVSSFFGILFAYYCKMYYIKYLKRQLNIIQL